MGNYLEIQLSKGSKGDLAELKAIVWLLDQGYEVYRNVSHFGLIDLVARKDDKEIFVDVKTLQKLKHIEGTIRPNPYYFEHSYYLSKEQLAKGIKPLFVFEDQVGWNRDYFLT